MRLSGFLTGAIVGCVAGLLLAPDKGENTRVNLADTADKWRDKFNRLLGRADTRVDDLRDFLSQNIDGLTDDVKNRILTILDEAQEMAYNPGATRTAGASRTTNGVL